MKAKFINNVFDVLTWSKDHLPEDMYQNVSDAHKGKYGEKVQTSLLKCQNKDELIKWHNLKFEFGVKESVSFKRDESISFKRGNSPYKNLKIGKHSWDRWNVYLKGTTPDRYANGYTVSAPNKESAAYIIHNEIYPDISQEDFDELFLNIEPLSNFQDLYPDEKYEILLNTIETLKFQGDNLTHPRLIYFDENIRKR